MNDQNSYLLAAKLRPTLTRLVRKMRKLSPLNGILSQTERSVLVLLENQSYLSAELAVMEKITPQSMGQVLNRLSSLSMITKNISAVDKRKIYVSLSPKGIETIQQVRQERDEWLGKAIAEVCDEDDQKALMAAVNALEKLVNF